MNLRNVKGLIRSLTVDFLDIHIRIVSTCDMHVFQLFYIHRDSVHFSPKKYGWSNHEATLNELPNQVGNDYRRRTPGWCCFERKSHGKINFCWTLTSFLKPQDKGLSAWVAGCIYFHIHVLYTYIYIHVYHIYI